MSENPARSELASSVSVSGSWRSNACQPLARRLAPKYANAGDEHRGPRSARAIGPTMHGKNKKSNDRDERRVEEQLRGADRHVGLFEHALGLASSTPVALGDRET